MLPKFCSGFALGWVGGDHELLIAACTDCSIPEVIAHDPAVCYYLRPLRLIDAKLTFFPCRNFRGILRKRYPEDMSECGMCQFWFPRPPLATIHDSDQDTQKLLVNVRHHLRLKQKAKLIMKNGAPWYQKFFACLRLVFIR